MENKQYTELEPTVKDKIADLESKMQDQNIQYVWSELYLNHSKYFLNEAKFYKSQNNIIYALNSLASSLELLYLADNLYSASKNFYDSRETLKKFTITEIAIDTNVESKGTSIGGIISGFGFLNIIAIIIAIFLVSLVVIYIIAKARKKNENIMFTEVNREIKKNKDYLLELDKSYLGGKITDSEYSVLRKEYNKKLIGLEKRRKSIVNNLDDLAYLESQLKYLHNKLSRTISFYTKGLISEEEYNRLVRDYKEEITNIKYNIEEDKKTIEKLGKNPPEPETKNKGPSPKKKVSKKQKK
jgi:uncharacterized membrane protein